MAIFYFARRAKNCAIMVVIHSLTVGARGRPRRVGGRGGGGAVSCASAGEAASGADLGGSSNYSNEIFED